MTSPSEQVLAARRAAGLFKEIPRGILAVRGKDRVRFLHNVVSHDIKGLTPGQGRPACLLDRQGKVLFPFFVIRLDGEILVETPEGQGPFARAALEKHRISESVEFEERPGRWIVWELHGPDAPEVLARVPLQPGFAVRWDQLRMPGFHLWLDPGAAEEISGKLLQEGKPLGLAEAGSETFEVLRIEAGAPWPGKEITPDVILNELGREDWVSFNKGCYIGQEIVARIKHRAHPPRLLTGFLLEGNEAPAVPCPVLREGQEAGTVTSTCFSPTLNRVIGLGFLKFGTPGDGLQVQTPSGPVPARQVPLPFI